MIQIPIDRVGFICANIFLLMQLDFPVLECPICFFYYLLIGFTVPPQLEIELSYVSRLAFLECPICFLY
jgi:hypothetical protein